MSRVPGWLIVLIIVAVLIFIANRLGVLSIHGSIGI